jgi:hypothetical protein
LDWPSLVANFLGSAIPAAAGVAVVKYLSDSLIERQKAQQSRDLQQTQNTFSVGATSHMATVAFDKHIGFCEEYVEEVSKALQALIDNGSAQEPLDVGSLSRIRQKWALWLTNDIDNELEQFERRVTQLGAEAPAVDANGDRVSNESSIKTAIAFLREVLRTEQLTALRNELVTSSSKRPSPVV